VDKKLIVVIAVVVIVAALPIMGRLFKGGSPSPASAAPEWTPASGATDAKAVAQDVATALTLGDWAAASSRFDATMKAALPQSKLAETWNAVGAQAGAFKRQLGTRVEKVQGMDAVFVTCEFERAKLDIQVTVNSTGQVSGLFLRPGK
jgi:hypothetical protein